MGMFETIIFGMSAAFICAYTLCFIKKKPLLRAFWGVVTMVFITLSAYNWRFALIDSGKDPAWLGFERYPASLILVVIVFAGGLYLVVSGLKQKYGANHMADRVIIDDSPERMKERQERHEFLINQYKASVTPLEMVLSGAELADYFSKVLYVEAVPLEQIPERFLAYNFENAYVNQNKIALNEGIWRVYRVLKDEKSELYYREYRVQHEGFAWFICEEKTGYFTSNSQLLFLEMELKQGLSREDYENETMDFFYYLERYDAYLQQKLLLQNIE